MWGRKKKGDGAAQASIAAVAPASYWESHAEPAAPAAPPADADEHPARIGNPAVPGVAPKVVVNGKEYDSASAEARLILSMVDQPPHDPSVHSTLTMNGREIDPESPEGRQLLALATGEQAAATAPEGNDGNDGSETYVLTGPGGAQRMQLLLPFIEEHRNHKITDAEFEAARRRILGGGWPS